MAIVDVVIRTIRSLPEIVSDTIIVGTVGDVGSHTLRFHRSSEYVGKDMRVLLSKDGNGWKQYDLGVTNELVLKDQFKSGDQLHLFAMFWSGDDYRIGTNVLVFIVRGAPESGVPDYLSTLVDRAIVDASTSNDGSKNEFKNLAGNVMFTLATSSGGGGHTILDAEGNPAPQRAQLQFAGAELSDTDDTTVVTVSPGPKGEPGKDGKDGAPGPAGPQGEPGPTIPPDWNQNNSTALDYVKNRPMYEDVGDTLFEGVDLPFNEPEPGAGRSIYMSERNLTFNEGQQYFVMLDEEGYNVVGFVFEELGDSTTLLGNLSLLEPSLPDTGEPFILVSGMPVPDVLSIIVSGTTPTHSISIVPINLHQLDAKFIPIGESLKIQDGKIDVVGGGTSVQSDWNQNDESALDHIKNRPFYTDPNVVLFAGVDLPFEDMDIGGSYAHVSKTSLTFVEGLTYYITWDGIEYSVLAELVMVGDSAVCIGNLSILGPSFPDTGEPFLLLPVDVLTGNPGYVSLIALDTTPTHTVSIVGEKDHKLNPKYLPLGAGLEVDEGKVVSKTVLPSYLRAEQLAGMKYAYNDDDTGQTLVYQKTLRFINNAPAKTTSKIPHGISSLNLRLLAAWGEAQFKNSTGESYAIPGNQVDLAMDKENLIVVNNNVSDISIGIVTIWYYK